MKWLEGVPSRLVVRWLALAAVGSVALDAVLPRSVLAGDPRLYNLRADELLSGRLPYVDAEFEHLPMMLPVVVAGRLLTFVMPGQSPALAYGLLMTAVILGATIAVGSAGRLLGVTDVLWRWIVVTTPLLPIVLFRLDPVPVALLAASVAALAAGDARRSAQFSFGGAAAKGWPLVVAVGLWARGERRLAAISVGAFAVLVAALLATPGFRSGRAYDGVHTETLVGSATLFVRNAEGVDLQLIEAAWSIYVAVPWWATVVHVGVGSAVAGLGLLRLARRPMAVEPALRLCGVLVAAAIVASPLLSSQFVFWLAPFVALVGGRWTRWLYVAVGVASTVLLAHWRLDTLWWCGLAFSRAIGVVAVGILLASEDGPITVRTGDDRSQSREAATA